MAQLFTNAARGELSGAILSTDTALSITSGGAAYPVANTGAAAISSAANWFKAILQNATNFEIIYVRTHTVGSNTFSDILRGQEGTTAVGFSTASIFGLRVTSQDISNLVAHVGSGDTAHALVVAASTAGFMSGADKTKLDTVAAGATNYTHPANHPASIVTQDASNRFVTDAEKTAWNAKQPAGTYATGSGSASGVNTGDQTNVSGNAATATLAGKATNVAGGLAGQIPYQTAVDTTALLAAGTAGQALLSGGAGAPTWGVAGGAKGGGTDAVFYENDQSIATNYTLTAGKNAMSAGPITIANGVTVTVPTGATWSVI